MDEDYHPAGMEALEVLHNQLQILVCVERDNCRAVYQENLIEERWKERECWGSTTGGPGEGGGRGRERDREKKKKGEREERRGERRY